MGFWAHGTTLTFDSITVGGLTSIGLPEQSKEEVEITAHDSEGWREFVPGLRDGGTVSLTARLKPDDVGQVALWENFNQNNEVGEVVITLPIETPAAVISFDAFVLDTGGEAPFDGAGEVTFTLRIKGIVQIFGVSV